MYHLSSGANIGFRLSRLPKLPLLRLCRVCLAVSRHAEECQHDGDDSLLVHLLFNTECFLDEWFQFFGFSRGGEDGAVAVDEEHAASS